MRYRSTATTYHHTLWQYHSSIAPYAMAVPLLHSNIRYVSITPNSTIRYGSTVHVRAPPPPPTQTPATIPYLSTELRIAHTT
eukprot:822166-Rhodomonas_salina.2